MLCLDIGPRYHVRIMGPSVKVWYKIVIKVLFKKKTHQPNTIVSVLKEKLCFWNIKHTFNNLTTDLRFFLRFPQVFSAYYAPPNWFLYLFELFNSYHRSLSMLLLDFVVAFDFNPHIYILIYIEKKRSIYFSNFHHHYSVFILFY